MAERSRRTSAKTEEAQVVQLDGSFVAAVDAYTRYFASGEGHTARAKRLDLTKFQNFLCRHFAYREPEQLKLSHFDYSSTQRFIDELLAQGEAPATVGRRLATLKHFGRTLSEQMTGFANPARQVKTPKLPLLRPKGLSEKEKQLVERKAKTRYSEKPNFTRKRNIMLFELLVDTGIRADEARLLKRGQLDDDLSWLRNIRTKGRRFRNVYVSEEIRERLADYLHERKAYLQKFYASLSRATEDQLPLFVSNYGADPKRPESFLMGAKSVWRAIHEIDPSKDLHPHLLRHSYALELLNHSNDIRLVAQALGHSDVRITMRYTERKDEEVAQAIEESRKKTRKNTGESTGKKAEKIREG